MADFEWMEGYDQFDDPDDWLDWLTTKYSGGKIDHLNEYYDLKQYKEQAKILHLKFPSLDKCSECNKGHFMLKTSKTKRLYVWECSYCKREEEFRENQVLDACCLKCDGKVKIKFGKYGAFIGCSNYPNCKFTWKLPFSDKVDIAKYIKDFNKGVFHSFDDIPE